MRHQRNQGGGCITLFAASSALSRCSNPSQSPHSDDATCGTPLWMGKGLTCVCFKRKGSHAQEDRLKRLRHRTKVYFDASRPDHQEALKALWSATYPGQELQSLVSDQWKEMGWQGKDPSTDFRGAGFISLENLLFFAKTFPSSFQSLLRKQAGKRADWEYPFAVAGVNITFMLMQMLDLDSPKQRSFIRALFLQMLSENEWAFDLLYSVSFMIMDKLWLEKMATYMEFNVRVLTRIYSFLCGFSHPIVDFSRVVIYTGYFEVDTVTAGKGIYDGGCLADRGYAFLQPSDLKIMWEIFNTGDRTYFSFDTFR